MNDSMLKNARMAKADTIITKGMKYCSYISGITLAVMAIWATVNVIYSKISMNSIPSTTDWIAYLLVPTVFLAVGIEILDSGLISVDLITGRFPEAVQKLIATVGYLIGAALSVLMCQQQFVSMVNLVKTKKMSSVDKLAFRIWPFSLITAVGLALMALAMIWFVIRLFAKKKECVKDTDELTEDGGEGI